MAQLPRHALARTYAPASNIAAVVNDDGGAARAVTVVAAGAYCRPYLAAAGGGGTSSADPFELFARASSQLTTGAGGGAWAVTLNPDGRTKITWTGVGTGEIASGDLLCALGFAAGTGALASGASALSTYPALGLLLWAYSESDSGWLPEQDSAGSVDGRGRAYSFRSSYVRWTRTATATWVPRAWALNDSGDYLSPAWHPDIAKGGSTSATAQSPSDAAEPTAWCDAVFSLSGHVPFAYTDDLQAMASGEFVSLVSLAPEMLEPGRFTMPEKAPTYGARRSVFVSLIRYGTEEL